VFIDIIETKPVTPYNGDKLSRLLRRACDMQADRPLNDFYSDFITTACSTSLRLLTQIIFSIARLLPRRDRRNGHGIMHELCACIMQENTSHAELWPSNDPLHRTATLSPRFVCISLPFRTISQLRCLYQLNMRNWAAAYASRNG
jgi:hypothetical protein